VIRANKLLDSEKIQIAVMATAEEQLNCKLTKEPGRGRTETYRTPDGKRVSLRSSRDGDLLYQPLNGGTAFKTLNDVNLVFLGTYDDIENPGAIKVYLFEASALLQRFNEAYTYRRKMGVIPADDVGMGITLRKIDSKAASRSHSGVLELGKLVTTIPIQQVAQMESRKAKAKFEPASMLPQSQSNTLQTEGDTVAIALAECRARIAKLTGSPLEAIALSLSITG
jgi:hypothetical protein